MFRIPHPGWLSKKEIGFNSNYLKKVFFFNIFEATLIYSKLLIKKKFQIEKIFTLNCSSLSLYCPIRKKIDLQIKNSYKTVYKEI